MIFWPAQEMTDLLRTTAVAVAEAVMRQQLAGGNDTAAAEVPDVVVRVESQLFALLLPGRAPPLSCPAARSRCTLLPDISEAAQGKTVSADCHE